MATQPIYIPMLKGKEGEFAALEVLETTSPDIPPLLMPLIEIPAIPYDYASERPARSLAEHLGGIAARLRKCWKGRPLYIDLSWLKDEEFGDGQAALETVLTDCVRSEVTAVPVVSRESSAAYLATAGRQAEVNQLGACLRLVVEDFQEEVDLEAEVNRLLNGLGTSVANATDLIVDLADLGSDVARALLICRAVFSVLPRKDEWRRIVLAAASFPEDLSDVGAATITTLLRREWELWKTLQRKPNSLPRRDLIFADYGIAHPVPKELDPRTMRMSANIRYTARDNWLVVKGRNVRQYGFDQYFELCKELVKRPEYESRTFSWGDRYIADCADGIVGPGNATTWRKVGTNHNITLVMRQIPNLHPGV